MVSAVLLFVISVKYLGFESLTGQAKHNQMSKLEQPGSQFGHGMILDILEYGIKALFTSRLRTVQSLIYL